MLAFIKTAVTETTKATTHRRQYKLPERRLCGGHRNPVPDSPKRSIQNNDGVEYPLPKYHSSFPPFFLPSFPSSLTSPFILYIVLGETKKKKVGLSRKSSQETWEALLASQAIRRWWGLFIAIRGTWISTPTHFILQQ